MSHNNHNDYKKKLESFDFMWNEYKIVYFLELNDKKVDVSSSPWQPKRVALMTSFCGLGYCDVTAGKSLQR